MHIGDQVPRDVFTKIDKGSILRLYGERCITPEHPTTSLQPLATFIPSDFESGSTVRSYIPRESLRNGYQALENDHNLEIDLDGILPSGKKFAKKETLFRIKERVKIPCVKLLYFLFEMDYIDGYGSYDRAAYMYTVGTLGLGQTGGGTYQTPATGLGSFGDEYYALWGSTEQGTVNISLDFEPPTSPDPCKEPNIHAVGKLVSLGRAYDFISGGYADGVADLGCGQSWGGWWTGVSYQFGPVGLVMSTGWNVTFSIDPPDLTKAMARAETYPVHSP